MNLPRAAAAALLGAAVALGALAPLPSAQQGGGTVTNSVPSLDADGTYSSSAGAFGDQDGQLGANLTINDGVAGNVYDKNGNGASGNWGQWTATAGATSVESGNGTNQNGRYIKARINATGAVAELFEFEAFDPNLESDIRFVRLESSEPALNDTANGSSGDGYAVVSADLARTTKPTSGAGVSTDGYAVWNPVTDDGFLSVQFRYTWPAGSDGTHTQKACARDEDVNWTCDAVNADLTSFSQNATVSVDFSSGNFTSTGGALVPLDGSIDLKWYAGSASNPSLVSTWQTSTDDEDGALSVQSAAPSHIWIWYTIDIPALAGDGDYVAAFTFS